MEKYAFVHVGSFSKINQHLRGALDEQLPDLSSEAIDVRAKGTMPPGNVLPFLREFGAFALRRPRAALIHRTATTYMFDRLGELARERAAAVSPRFVLQTQTLFDAALKGVPFYIYTDHTALANDQYPQVGHPVRWPTAYIERERLAYERADAVFTSSEFTRRSLIEDYRCDPQRIVTVESGINMEPPTEPIVRSGPMRTILFVGTDWERKGGQILLAAFRRVRAEVPDASLVVVGSTPPAEVGVTVLGRVNSAEVARQMTLADVFCMPSWSEPSAVAYTEAAAHALPVVATIVGGTPERVLHGKTGLLCDPGDPVAVAELLLELFADPARARAMGAAGREMVGERFLWPVVAAKIAQRLQ